MEVILIRHTSVDVPHGTCYGQSDVPLNATFEQEAAVTNDTLKQYRPFDMAYTSPLTRATRLATFCGFPDAQRDTRLMEIDMGEWEMKRYDEIDDPNLAIWFDNYMRHPATGGESFPQLYKRVASFLDDLRQKPYKRVAVFAHGGVLICAGIYAGLFEADNNAFSHLASFGGVEHITL